MIDQFMGLPDFPFARYFENAAQFASAQRYWQNLLAQNIGFDDVVWRSIQRQEEPCEKMRLGLVVDIVSTQLGKAILIHANSMAGAISNALYHAGPMDPMNLLQGLSATKRAEITQGIMHDKVRDITIQHDVPTMIWVEPGFAWCPDMSHPEGGVEMRIERLIITSEVSPTAQVLASMALAIFLSHHGVQDRINAQFRSLWPHP
jgi:hypothetical protein